MKLVHAADLHIDSPLVGLARYEGAPVERIRSATRRAFSNLIGLCERERVELLLLAGDLFDGDWKDYSTGLFFLAELARLKSTGTRVVLVRGNHDAASHITKNLALPDNVIELSSQHVDTRRFDDLGVAVHGQSYGTRAETRNLAHSYPHALPGYFNIGLLHTCVSGRAGHEPYAPCTLGDLVSKGYGYWALGHVHLREVLSESPWVVFAGNLQGRHLKETGPKGATVIELEGGIVTRVEARELCVVRFEECVVAAEPDDDADAVVERAARAIDGQVREVEGRTLVLRLVVRGATRAHSSFQVDPERWENELRARATELGEVWLADVAFRTEPERNLARARLREDAVGQVLRAVTDAKGDPRRLAEFADLFAELAAKLPPEVREGSEVLRVDDPATIQATLDEVEQLLLVHLVDEGA